MATVVARATAGSPIAVMPRATIEQIALNHFDPTMHPRVVSLALLPAVEVDSGLHWCQQTADSTDDRLAYYAEVHEDPLATTCCGEPGDVPERFHDEVEAFNSTTSVLRMNEDAYVLALDAQTGQVAGAAITWPGEECEDVATRTLVNAVVERPFPIIVSTRPPPAETAMPGPSSEALGALNALVKPDTSTSKLDAVQAVMAIYPLGKGNQWEYRSICRDSRFWYGALITETVRSVAFTSRGVLVAHLAEHTVPFSPADIPPDACAGDATTAAGSVDEWLITDGRFLLRSNDPDHTRRLIEMIERGEKNVDFPDCLSVLDQPELILSFPLQPGDIYRCDANDLGNMETWSVLSQVSAETPAGRFKQCHLMEWPWGQGAGFKWLCDGVGVVRVISSRGGSLYNQNLFELIRFLPSTTIDR